jgi:hypothetical protein
VRHRHIGLSVVLLLTGCGQAPELDPRNAAVVAESAGLEGAVWTATSWWYEATRSEVAFHVADACSADKACVRVRFGALPEGEAGVTKYPIGHPEVSDTTLSDELAPELAGITIAHELGHVLGLAHDDGVMAPIMNDARWVLPGEWHSGEK